MNIEAKQSLFSWAAQQRKKESFAGIARKLFRYRQEKWGTL
jgi:hypothetical protein